MNLHVVAYPEVDNSSYDLIQSYRQAYNSLYNVIEPHFTLVFSVGHMDVAAFIDEVKQVASSTKKIDFCSRCLAINKDSFSKHFDAFLIPDEGHSDVIKLHDKLYSGLLAPHHRIDITYVPHVSLANSPDVRVIKTIVDKWNAEDHIIQGRISFLDVINYENRKVETLERVALK